MKTGVFAIVLLLLFATLASARPNFIFMFADDLGWGDLGCYGHPRLKTPYLDKMAEDGLLVSNFYMANPVCSPSRTAVMTGQFPARHRIHRHLGGSHARNAAHNMADYLDPNVTILTKLMHQQGYKTGHFGKWHLGSTEGAPPFAAYGIDVHYTSNSRYGKLNVPQHQSTEKMVDEAIDFIKANKEQSFYINLWTLVPHTTLVTTDEQMAPYAQWGPHDAAKQRGFSTPDQIYYGAVTDLNVADRYPDEVKRFSKMLREFKASIPQGVPQQGGGSNVYPMPGAND